MLNRLSAIHRRAVDEWYRFAHRQHKGLSVRLHISLVDHILQFYGCGGARLLHQYIFGFQLIGEISYTVVSPGKEPMIATPLSSAEIKPCASRRFPPVRNAAAPSPTHCGGMEPYPKYRQDGSMRHVS